MNEKGFLMLELNLEVIKVWFSESSKGGRFDLCSGMGLGPGPHGSKV